MQYSCIGNNPSCIVSLLHIVTCTAPCFFLTSHVMFHVYFLVLPLILAGTDHAQQQQQQQQQRPEVGSAMIRCPSAARSDGSGTSSAPVFVDESPAATPGQLPSPVTPSANPSANPSDSTPVSGSSTLPSARPSCSGEAMPYPPGSAGPSALHQPDSGIYPASQISISARSSASYMSASVGPSVTYPPGQGYPTSYLPSSGPSTAHMPGYVGSTASYPPGPGYPPCSGPSSYLPGPVASPYHPPGSRPSAPYMPGSTLPSAHLPAPAPTVERLPSFERVLLELERNEFF